MQDAFRQQVEIYKREYGNSRQNTSYLMKLIEAGKEKVEAPVKTRKVYTNFVR